MQSLRTQRIFPQSLSGICYWSSSSFSSERPWIDAWESGGKWKTRRGLCLSNFRLKDHKRFIIIRDVGHLSSDTQRLRFGHCA